MWWIYIEENELSLPTDNRRSPKRLLVCVTYLSLRKYAREAHDISAAIASQTMASESLEKTNSKRDTILGSASVVVWLSWHRLTEYFSQDKKRKKKKPLILYPTILYIYQIFWCLIRRAYYLIEACRIEKKEE